MNVKFITIKFLIPISIVCFIISSCSFLTRIEIMKQHGNKDWHVEHKGYSYSTFNYTAPAFSFKSDSLIILVTTCPFPGRAISFGPPFIPIIPNLMMGIQKGLQDKFFVDMRFVNTTNKEEKINLSEIVFKHIDDSIIPFKVFTIDPRHFALFDTSKIQVLNVESSLLKINAMDSISVRFDFDILTLKMHKLSILFRNARQNFSVPDLNLKSKGILIYRPLYLQ